MYSIQYVYILLSCVIAEVMTQGCFFSCHGTGKAGGFSFCFLTMWTLWIHNICTRIPQLVCLSQTRLSLPPSSRLSLCALTSCVFLLCSRQDLSLICKLSAIAAHYVNVLVCIYRKQLQWEVRISSWAFNMDWTVMFDYTVVVNVVLNCSSETSSVFGGFIAHSLCIKDINTKDED